MEKRIRTALLTTATLLCGMLFWLWQHRPPLAVQVHTTIAETQDIYNSITIFGTIEAAENVAVCPKENAVVRAVYVSVGDTVQQGDVLCMLADVGREQVTDYRQAVQSIFALSGPVYTVVAEDVHVLRAPIDGTILAVPQLGTSVLAGIPCTQIAASDRLRVRAKSPELYAGELAVGQRADITVSAVDKTYNAYLTTIAPAAIQTFSLTGDNEEATIEVLLDLSGQTVGLRPGYSATIKVFTDHHENAVVTPYEAVCQRGEQEYVFVVENSHAVQRMIQTGYLLENMVEIANGISDGETVILSPSDELTNGDLVEVLP